MIRFIPEKPKMFLIKYTLLLIIILLPATCETGMNSAGGWLYGGPEPQSLYPGNRDMRERGMGRNNFRVSVSQTFDREGKSRLLVNTWVPYNKLVFLRKEDHYEANYRLFISVLDDEGDHLEGRVLEKKVVLKDYQKTRETNSASTHKELIPVKNGEYKVKAELKVIDTSLHFKREVDIRVVGGDMNKFELSEPLFSSGRKDNTTGSPPRGEIIISARSPQMNNSRPMKSDRVYSGFNTWPAIYYTLGGIPRQNENDPAYLVVSAEVRDESGSVLLYNRKLIETGPQHHFQLCLEFDSNSFYLGRYRISIAVSLGEKETRVNSSGSFMILFSRGMLNQYLEDTLGILSLFADDSELDIIRNAPPVGRIDAWREFWKKRNSDREGFLPASEDQFLSRLKFIQMNFTRFGEAWKTDRGRVYLRYGQPEQVDSRTNRYGTEYLLWYYYSRGELYIFRDMASTGDYELVETRMI